MTGYSAEARAYLEAHAIDPVVAAEVGVREQEPGVLLFPYIAEDGSTFDRGRSLNGSGRAKVMQPKGKPLVPWWPAGAPKQAESVLVCEGESDALAALAALREAPACTGLRDLPVVAVPGTGFPPAKLAEALAAVGAREVRLALDADDAGRGYTKQAIEGLCAAGIKPFTVMLPDGRDLADCAAAADDAGEWIANLLIDAQAAGDDGHEPAGNDTLPAARHASRGAPERPELRVVPLVDFAAIVEPSAEALLGTDDDAAFTAGGVVITYGDGGQGKTTLAIDGLAHLAAGLPWLGLPVARPLRVVLVENEGPRGRFRRKLRRKIETWPGPPFAPNVRALEEPWGSFTFGDETLSGALAAACNDFDADMVVIGPLVSLGAEGGGTPEEVSRFERLLAQFRAQVARPLLVWFAHHENKAGDVSGAWERLPDTMMHVRLEGRRQTNVHWEKARWASDLHGERWTLRWLEDREGFERVDAPERDVRAEIVALWEADLSVWRTLTEIAEPRAKGGIGRARADVKAEVEALVAECRFVSEAGPSGRSPKAVCYRPAGLVPGPEQVEQVGAGPLAENLPARPALKGRAEQVGRASNADLIESAQEHPEELLGEGEIVERLEADFDARALDLDGGPA